MKTLFGRLLVSWLILLVPSLGMTQDTNAYTLAVGDVVSIHVFNEPDLSYEKVPINDSGKIQFQFIGEVQATGRTVAQLQQAIVTGLKPDYLVNPRVTVSIVEYRPFFLAGEVNKPGSYPYQPGLILRQALTIAGGLTDRASTSKITVISGGKSRQPVKIGLDYEIKPGDTITIEESFF